MLKIDDSILLKVVIFYCVGSIILLYLAYDFYNDKIVTQNYTSRIFATRIMPLALILGSIWFSGEPILDYIIKDYKIKTGILEQINAPYKRVSTEQLFIEGEVDSYSLPKGILKDEEKGKLYEFKYAKRSRIILEIHEVKK
ncbi:hypothetical protein SDC9_163924 [bioreactor metagenome]|uniref:Uncharacterized protein n=1 Tax=bioreactor metagenome TaxID=1076179 RepID=A0A645FT10_9ZZZZ|nr:hypothetical protein [Romboutsia lituseburensis]